MEEKNFYYKSCRPPPEKTNEQDSGDWLYAVNRRHKVSGALLGEARRVSGNCRCQAEEFMKALTIIRRGPNGSVLQMSGAAPAEHQKEKAGS
jgi:hypothetical protein